MQGPNNVEDVGAADNCLNIGGQVRDVGEVQKGGLRGHGHRFGKWRQGAGDGLHCEVVFRSVLHGGEQALSLTRLRRSRKDPGGKAPAAKEGKHLRRGANQALNRVNPGGWIAFLQFAKEEAFIDWLRCGNDYVSG